MRRLCNRYCRVSFSLKYDDVFSATRNSACKVENYFPISRSLSPMSLNQLADETRSVTSICNETLGDDRRDSHFVNFVNQQCVVIFFPGNITMNHNRVIS